MKDIKDKDSLVFGLVASVLFLTLMSFVFINHQWPPKPSAKELRHDRIVVLTESMLGDCRATVDRYDHMISAIPKKLVRFGEAWYWFRQERFIQARRCARMEEILGE